MLGKLLFRPDQRRKVRDAARRNWILETSNPFQGRRASADRAIAATKKELTEEFGSVFTSILISFAIKLAIRWIENWLEEKMFSNDVPPTFNEKL